MLISRRKRNIMLTDRANDIIEEAAKITVKEVGHHIYPDGSVKAFEREAEMEIDYEVGDICWQCNWFEFPGRTIREFVQAFSPGGPMNFSYLALMDGEGAIIEESLWTDREMAEKEAQFAREAFLDRMLEEKFPQILV